MLRFSNTKSSMLYNLLSVDKAQMFLLDVVLDKNPVQYVSVSQYVSALLHWYSSNRTPSDVTRLGLNWYSWDWPLLLLLLMLLLLSGQSCVTAQEWDSINYWWDWPFLSAFVRRQNIKVQPPWEVWVLRLAITWSQFGVRENLKLQNHSNNYELSKNAIKMMFFLISGQR